MINMIVVRLPYILENPLNTSTYTENTQEMTIHPSVENTAPGSCLLYVSLLLGRNLYINSKNTIITIGREYGSAGRQIGYKVAEDLGIKLYDRELLERAAKESGICEELFETHDEKPTNSFLYSLVMDSYSFGYPSSSYTDMPINHKIFLAQFDTIRKIASEGPCILVGRCADYALEEFDNVLSVFIHADMDARIRRIARIYDLTDAKAKDLIKKTDKRRSSYYNYYSNKKWGAAESYKICLDSSLLGIDGTAKAIEQLVELKENITDKKL